MKDWKLCHISTENDDESVTVEEIIVDIDAVFIVQRVNNTTRLTLAGDIVVYVNETPLELLSLFLSSLPVA